MDEVLSWILDVISEIRLFKRLMVTCCWVSLSLSQPREANCHVVIFLLKSM